MYHLLVKEVAMNVRTNERKTERNMKYAAAEKTYVRVCVRVVALYGFSKELNVTACLFIHNVIAKACNLRLRSFENGKICADVLVVDEYYI